MTRQLHLNAFLMNTGHHEASWRLPESDPYAHVELGHYVRLARIAERGTFDSLFLADGPQLWNNLAQRPAGALEPLTLLTALATATEHIGLIATASTSYNIMPAVLPSGLEAFVGHVVPILRARGLLRAEYGARRTLRERYGLPRPANQYTAPAAALV
ncbi:LLM class flavin-dependent oxidoreductase [Streptomyces sp. NPDC096012]|uniref:LLM class flavin-dependent oxidoreductase n=1 Tax=Streptomyces sp. NPDC096012 TaxID=3155684 RepID=UPI003369FC6E